MTDVVTPRPLPDGYRFAALEPDRARDIAELDAWAFPTPASVDELATIPLPITWPRTVGVIHDVQDPTAVPVDGATPIIPRLVGLHSSYAYREFAVPGATVAAAGLTWVAVHPQHRRRGLLTAMIDRHLADCRERGEPFSALFAAEPAIYGRFGYGLAANELRLDVPRQAALRDVPGADRHTVRIEEADRALHGEVVADLHRRAGERPGSLDDGPNRPGWVNRETAAHETAWWADPRVMRRDHESRRIAIVELDGEPRAYATFWREFAWQPSGPHGSVHTHEVVALDAAAARALWGVLTDLDLTDRVEAVQLALDDPIRDLLVDPRKATPALADNLWLRVVDVPAALTGRRYAADIEIVLHVTDERIAENNGHWRLTARAFGPARAERTAEAADLSIDVRDLAAAYLGGTSLAQLATAGLVAQHVPGAVARAAVAFGWPLAPLSSFTW